MTRVFSQTPKAISPVLRFPSAMSFAAGQALAYLKIGVVALAVMATVWAVVKVVEARGRRKIDGGDPRDG